MCGIVYMQDFEGNPVNNAILDQFDSQRHRGTQGFGIYDGSHDNIITTPKENGILKWLVKYDSPLLLLHHRYPTSTINVKRAAHPFTTKKFFGDNEYILVHNGSVSNSRTLREEHEALGIEYYSVLQDGTFNDSEALLWDFALTMEGKQDSLKAKGNIAFIAIKLEKGKMTKMHFARNTGSPLLMKRDKQGIQIASELDGEVVPTDTLHTFNYKLKRLTKRQFTVPTKYAYVERDYEEPTTSWEYGRQGSTFYDCNCNEVGWSNCNYHGYPEPVARSATGIVDRGESTLVKQFGKKFGVKSAPTVGEILTHQQQLELAEDRLLQTVDPILPEEITTEYYSYLASVKGHFESAYWSMEADYYNVSEAPKTRKNIRAKRLLEYVMERIQNDPEYVNDASKSEVWEDIWRANQKTA